MASISIGYWKKDSAQKHPHIRSSSGWKRGINTIKLKSQTFQPSIKHLPDISWHFGRTQRRLTSKRRSRNKREKFGKKQCIRKCVLNGAPSGGGTYRGNKQTSKLTDRNYNSAPARASPMRRPGFLRFGEMVIWRFSLLSFFLQRCELFVQSAREITTLLKSQ